MFVKSDDTTTNIVNYEHPVKWGSQAIKSCNATSEECKASAIDHMEIEKNVSTQLSHPHFQVENMHNEKPGNPDDGASESAQADINSVIQVETLRFEVSQYTGRIHLYVCIPGKDSRPRPIFINFRPEELESLVDTTGKAINKTALQLLKENPAGYKIFQEFITEWNCLRSIDRNKLLGKPLQLPLSVELCYLKEAINHGSGGLLKGGSKRRVTPVSDMRRPLNENAVWKKVSLRSTAKEIEYTQAWTINSEPLCKLCQEPCKGMLGKEPEYFEDLFCNLSCFQEYRIRTSRGALRQELFQIEHGVCTHCKLDCHKLVKCVRPLSVARRKEYIQKFAPKLAERKKLFDKLVHEPIEGNAWHADHIIPVFKGGGECRLENMRTLCVACHAETTMIQQKERKLERKRAKEQLKNTMKELDDCDHRTDGDGDKEPEQEGAEDVLFIEVPGSDYSRETSIR
ncbi:DNA annealing helicase and endonuclease ZRANB3 [Iris pallida]|uniref:DNA annealing helicase and endonuclease ZRANB3 n=1 Tax=Iris pallida TaxID=29817 RepID=A0AAX6F4D7_IRIPA|nr:DNA annealing helicase and endonuclease ZRANB3 [Iris pallida]